ncbi:MAG: cytochrome c [Flavobacteriaceae bacterium]|nr:cytochrome c [Flavobacteriaceae bacterium]
MKSIVIILSVLLSISLMSCGSKEEKKKEGFSYEQKSKPESTAPAKLKTVLPSERVDLTNKGIGPITSIEINTEVSQEMALKGEDIYKKMCTACHRPTKKFIGPAPLNILERRTPEWVMNMILNPEEMLQKDPLAKDLLAEFNGAPMANQNLTQEEARAVLEYFRTLK